MSKERHAHEDALNETEFDELLDGAGTLTPPQNLEATFIIMVDQAVRTLAGRRGAAAASPAGLTNI